MSQCHLEADGTGDYIVIGWDPQTPYREGTFFCVVETESDSAADRGPSLQLGTGIVGDFFPDDPRMLIDAVSEFAPPFDHDLVYRELMKDRASNSERSYCVEGDSIIDE